MARKGADKAVRGALPVPQLDPNRVVQARARPRSGPQAQRRSLCPEPLRGHPSRYLSEKL